MSARTLVAEDAAAIAERPPDYEHVRNCDGTYMRRLTGRPEPARFQARDAIPAWHPNGQQIDVEVHNGDESEQYYLLNVGGSG